jgi:integrase
MLEMVLTRDHVSLSSPTKEVLHTSAIRCMRDAEAEQIEDLLRHSLAANTIRAHQSDMQHYLGWGGKMPAMPSEIAAYIAAYAGKLAVSTVERRIATLSKAHDTLRVDNPCRSPLVKATLQGLRRKHGTVQKQAKPLVKEELFAILDAMGDGMKDVRDRALLLLGFAGGFRRSELMGLDVADIEHVRQGIIITLRRSKTDQDGAGRKIGIPHGRTRHCPVTSVSDWLTRSGITEGAIFRPINRHGQLQSDRLSGDAVSEVIRERLTAAGLDPEGYSGHSLRAGFATSAAQAGASTLKIRAQTGHASDAMLSRYIRDGELFVGNAAGALL